MRLFLTFFLFVCFHLLGGLGFAYTTNYIPSAAYSQSHGLSNMHQVAREARMQQSFFTNFSDETCALNSLTCVEDENEEDSDYSPKKYHLPAEYFSAFHQAFNATYSRNERRGHSLCADESFTISCKYIVNRTLRI